ncbi:MAG TPA: hypothetical protein VL197_09005 [Nitrospirota bacterium]|nr:hypothetical protein [Nitrospirota bacterium]
MALYQGGKISMTQKSPQTREELERHLQEQLRLMTASIVSFDKGLEEEGKRLEDQRGR